MEMCGASVMRKKGLQLGGEIFEDILVKGLGPQKHDIRSHNFTWPNCPIAERRLIYYINFFVVIGNCLETKICQ